jgi:hypothetical protein
MIQGGQSLCHQRLPGLLVLDGNAALMPGVSENAIKVLRLDSANRNRKSKSSARLPPSTSLRARLAAAAGEGRRNWETTLFDDPEK